MAVPTVWVDDDFTPITPGWGVTHFDKIQDGVDAVDPGGTVNVAAGTYEEQVEIAKDLSLIGAGVGATVVQSPPTLTKFFTTAGPNDNYPIIYVHDTGSVNISDLTVDGLGRGNANYRFLGVAYRNAGGLLTRAEVLDIRDTPISGSQHGVGVYAFADNGTARSVDLYDVDISGFQKNGTVFAGVDLSTQAELCTVTGAGAVAFIAQNGIQVSGGATAAVLNNTVTGFAYEPATAASAGMLIYSAGGSVGMSGNNVGESQVGIWYIDSEGSIEDNVVTYTVAGMGATPYWWGIVADPGEGGANMPPAAPFEDGGPAAVAPRDEPSQALLTTGVNRNFVDGGGNGTGIEGDVFGTETLDLTASENRVINCAAAFSLYKDPTAFLNATLFNNSADASNTIGLENVAGVLQDASGNWWGSNDAATVAAAVGVDADYTPFLGNGSDTDMAPGFQGDFSDLHVEAASPQTGALDRLSEAMSLASGTTITLGFGTYTTFTQQVVGFDLILKGQGAGLTTINKNWDTSSSGDARGWWVVEAGFDFDLADLTLDGTGYKTYQAIRNKGEGSCTNVIFKEIKFDISTAYAGVGIAAFGTGPVDVTDCDFSGMGRIGVLCFGTGVSGSTFSGNTYTGKGVGDWLDYFLDISAGASNILVMGNTVSGNRGVASSDGSTSAGFLVTTFFAAGTEATFTNNSINDNTHGIAVGFDGSDTSVVEAHCNDISGNDVGISTTAPTVDATNNWWGDASGPYNLTSNPGGLGDPVDDGVTFTPWRVGLTEISVLPAYGVTNCSTGIPYTFWVEQCGAAEEIRGIDVIFSITPGVTTITTPSDPGDFTEGTFLSSVGGTAFFVLDQGGGTYRVNSAILGGSTGATGSGGLFSVVLTPVAEGTSPIDITTTQVRDLVNAPLSSGGIDGVVQVDCTVPTMTWPLVEAENVCYNTAPTFSIFRFNDDVNLDLGEYQIDALGWNTVFTGIDTTDWNGDGWALPGFAGLGEGAHTVYFRVKDDAGNYNGEGTPDTYTWAFIKDTTVPAAPTDFVAAPGNNKVHLTWTNPLADPSWVGVEIRVVGWTDYPQYGTPGPPAPSYPANETQGTLVVQTALAAYTDNPRTPRDIYYYAAFSYDCAGNYSAGTPVSRDRATSYWLGDIFPATVGDGVVQIQDLANFSLTYGVAQGGTGWNQEADFGPTDDFSRFGIPLPDDIVEFEDLMIFAMNYGNVTAAGSSGFEIVETRERLSEKVSFRLDFIESEGDLATFAVVVDNRSQELKGIAIDVDYGAAGELVRVTPSGSLSRSDVFFGTMDRGMGRVHLGMAALGVNTPLRATGELARVVVRRPVDGSAEVRLATVDVRNINNEKEDIVFSDDPVGTPFVPTESVLAQNHPNPFNPITTITYDVAVAGDVRVEIYDVTGRLVRMLVNEYKTVGRYTAAWNAKDANGTSVHSGVYFYRMSAPGYRSPAKKMLLLK